MKNISNALQNKRIIVRSELVHSDPIHGENFRKVSETEDTDAIPISPTTGFPFYLPTLDLSTVSNYPVLLHDPTIGCKSSIGNPGKSREEEFLCMEKVSSKQ